MDEKYRDSLTIRLRREDAKRIEQIKGALGIQSDTEAVRHALFMATRDEPSGVEEKAS